MTPTRAEPVAVTGLGIVCSIGADVDAFEAALRRGRSGIRPGRDAGADGAESPPSAEIRGFDLATAVDGLGSLPAELRRRARRVAGRSPFAVQVAVVAALQGWRDAGLHRAPLPAGSVGLVVAGNNLTGRYAWDRATRFRAHPAYLNPRFALHGQDTDHVGTLSQVLGVTGEGCTVGGASASGNVGLLHGGRMVASGAADACLVVGALADLSPMERRGFLHLGAMAPPGVDSRPFDRDHGGFVYGQGAACLVLERPDAARRRGARLLAELAGCALRLDANALADPREEGELRAMAEALRLAGRAPGELAYVNAHGTGSSLGDETEVRALRRLLGDAFGRPWINATKGLTGHCLTAAGVVEAVATVVQMRGGFVHPNHRLERPIDADARFVGGRTEAAEVGLALSNSFGFGGINTAVVLARPRL
jgi:malonyl-ACP decarboxylase